jgi:tetratricopeptide (TPR) repeat protein/DNA-binding CsgD family transcriptional regulator
MIRGGHAIDDAIDTAENIMDDDAAGADSLMKLIDPSAVRNKERLARYALLYTAAEYKNYQTISSDSIIMIAVRHYTINNNLDYRFLSYYYLGCVYMELRQYRDAAVAFTQAEQLDDRIDNDYWKGLLYSQLGTIFNESCDFHRADYYFSLAESCFKRSNKELHHLYALFDIGDCKFHLQEYRVADSIMRIVEQKSIEFNDSSLYVDCLINRLSYSVYMNEPDSAAMLFNTYNEILSRPYNTPGYYEMMALYCNMVKDNHKSESYLEQAWKCDLSVTDSIYLYFVSSQLDESKGQTDKSFDLYKKYTLLQNENLREVLSQPVLAAQKEQYKILAENEQLKNIHARMTLILCVVIFMLIIVIVLVTYHYKKKHMKEQLYDSLAIVDELTGKIEQLKNQVRVQFHERHDLSNRLYSMYFDSESQDKVTKQQLNVTINSLIKDYTAPDSVRRLDALINESYDGIMDRLITEDIGLSDKELQLLRFSFAGLSSKSVSVIIKESPQNIYQIKSRLLKKVRRNSEELWETLNTIC